MPGTSPSFSLGKSLKSMIPGNATCGYHSCFSPSHAAKIVRWGVGRKSRHNHVCPRSGKASECLRSWLYPNRWKRRNEAVLRLLNIPDDTVRQVVVRVGGSIRAGGLSLRVQACVVRPAALPWNAAAFLQASSKTRLRPPHKLFDGWLIANDPAAAVLETPTIAVSLVGCDGRNEHNRDDWRGHH